MNTCMNTCMNACTNACMNHTITTYTLFTAPLLVFASHDSTIYFSAENFSVLFIVSTNKVIITSLRLYYKPSSSRFVYETKP